MSYRKHLYNPEARKAEAEMREREAIKDAAYESFDLLKKVADELAVEGVTKPETTHAVWAHIKKIKAGQ